MAVRKYAKVRAFLKPMMPAKGGADDGDAAFVNMLQKRDTEGDEALSDAELKEAVQVQASTFLNMAICFYLMEEYQKSIARATESLELQKNVKAFYRRARAKAAVKDFWGAVSDLQEAIEMDPSDPNNFSHELA